MYRKLWANQHECTCVRYRANKWWVKRSKQGNISVPPAHLVLLSAGLGAFTEVARLPGRVRIVRASLPAPPLPSLPLEQAAHRQCVVPSVTKTSTSSLLGALLQCWHQIMDQLVHRPAKVPGRGGGEKENRKAVLLGVYWHARPWLTGTSSVHWSVSKPLCEFSEIRHNKPRSKHQLALS